MSSLNRETWKPSWDVEGRCPAFFGSGGFDMVVHGGKRYLWGNMLVLNVLNLQQNEGLDKHRDHSLLFAGKKATH